MQYIPCIIRVGLDRKRNLFRSIGKLKPFNYKYWQVSQTLKTPSKMPSRIKSFLSYIEDNETEQSTGWVLGGRSPPDGALRQPGVWHYTWVSPTSLAHASLLKLSSTNYCNIPIQKLDISKIYNHNSQR